jgi:hypothetical protein
MATPALQLIPLCALKSVETFIKLSLSNVKMGTQLIWMGARVLAYLKLVGPRLSFCSQQDRVRRSQLLCVEMEDESKGKAAMMEVRTTDLDVSRTALHKKMALSVQEEM